MGERGRVYLYFGMTPNFYIFFFFFFENFFFLFLFRKVGVCGLRPLGTFLCDAAQVRIQLLKRISATARTD